MAGTRKVPRLRFDGRYYVANIYRPDGKRTSISFGPADERSEGEIYKAFGEWLDLYNQFPQKVLDFQNPYDAISQTANPKKVVMVGELVAQYLAWLRKNLQLEGVRIPDNHKMVYATKRVSRFLEKYYEWPVMDFGPDELKNVRQAMEKHRFERGKRKIRYTRSGINDNINHIQRIWNWGVGREYVTDSKAKRLGEVKALRIGQGVDIPRRERVNDEEFQKVCAKVSSIVADMLGLLWCTAMRPGEVCKMRPCDILRDDLACWLYVPGRGRTPVGEHKTTGFGRIRVVTLTGKAQEILLRRITDFNSRKYIFMPTDAISELYEKRAKERKTPLNCGNRPGTNRKKHPMISPGEFYTTNALRSACARGCVRAGVKPFTPYDLRRTVATRTRATLGKEAARVLLGHTKTDTTDIYLLEEVQEAMKVAKLMAAHEM